jgi:creatinine amidohydrolase/Fe(II)-dependent formamide hydrolase-like protein
MPELAHLTWLDAQEAIAKADVALLAVGSCEQHCEDIVETAYARALEFARGFAEEPLPGDGG